jgi:hypothetical protein
VREKTLDETGYGGIVQTLPQNNIHPPFYTRWLFPRRLHLQVWKRLQTDLDHALRLAFQMLTSAAVTAFFRKVKSRSEEHFVEDFEAKNEVELYEARKPWSLSTSLEG